MGSLAFDSYLVGGSSGKGTSDALEQRIAIRKMCAYIADDSKIASYHGVPAATVQRIRRNMALAKRKGPERQTVSHSATGADAANPFEAENKMRAMIRRGSDMLLEAILRERGLR